MNEDERIVYRSLLAMVLQWRNFDGDGITDSLRQDIMKSLAFYSAASQPAVQADAEKGVIICDGCDRDKNYCLCDAFKETTEWLLGVRSMTNLIPQDPFDT